MVKYEKGSGRILEEYELREIELEELQTLFGETSFDPMYHSYDVSEAQRSRLEKAASVRIDLKSFDYCVDANATGEKDSDDKSIVDP
jgi:hypothetical protein